MHDRFLVVVLSAYRQMRAQDVDVLCDVGEDNFDKAFQRIRPLIQGNADLGPRLSESEVQQALDFCNDMFTTSPEDHAAVRQRAQEAASANTEAYPTAAPVAASASSQGGVMSTLFGWIKGTPLQAEQVNAAFDVKAPVLPRSALDDIAKQVVMQRLPDADPEAIRQAEEETKRVLSNINARRIIQKDHINLHSLEEEELVGYSVRLQKGSLGLEKQVAAAA